MEGSCIRRCTTHRLRGETLVPEEGEAGLGLQFMFTHMQVGMVDGRPLPVRRQRGLVSQGAVIREASLLVQRPAEGLSMFKEALGDEDEDEAHRNPTEDNNHMYYEIQRHL